MNSSTSPHEFADAFWSFEGNRIVGTGAIAGVPFGIEARTTSDEASISVETHTQAAGPNHFDNPDNWLDGSLPELGDTVLVTGGNSIYYGMDSPRVFAELHIASDFAGQIGLEEKNARGYREYRPTYCTWSAKQMTIGQGGLLNSTLIKLDMRDADCKLFIASTGDNQRSLEPPMQIKGAMGEITVQAGTVEFACRPYDLASFHALFIEPDAMVKVGVDVMAGLIRSRGASTIHCNCNSLDVAGGKCHFRGRTNEIEITGGELVYDSSEEMRNLRVGPGIFYYAGLTHCNCETLRLRSGGQVVDPAKAIQADTIVLEGSVPLGTSNR
jgi:hypothetical protein